MRRFPEEGRFDVRGNPDEVASARRVLWKYTRLWYRPGLSKKKAYWLLGSDRQAGGQVYIHPRGEAYAWEEDLAIETVARRVQALASPYTVPVLQVGPGIVFAAPPPVCPRPSLPIEAAAACALQACDVMARLHEQGCGRLGFGPSHLRLVEQSGGLQIRWLVPGVADLDLLEALEALAIEDDCEAEAMHPRWRSNVDPIQHDLWQLAFFFFSLLAMDMRTQGAFEPDRREALRTLTQIRDGGPEAGGIHDAAAMAGLFAVLAHLPRAGAEPLPVVRVLPRLYPDWDEVIVEGEAMLEEALLQRERGSHRDWVYSVKLPLAAAYHQRASRTWARGDVGAALGDVDRALALDDHAPYHTTRAVLLDMLDRRTEARAAIATAFKVDARQPPWGEQDTDNNAKNVERARAHLTRGILALRERSLDAAEADLRRAEELDPTPASARARAAVRRARERTRPG
ncbi:hypothetical protein [Polyangium sorediatum]|uniref:Tetratricopeptide repeat protein n=1 Tax=Polyangium sorediatum TaxID=889274 RepID=A0ABT6P9Z1_9BACT|nr:hypothetical protein [Polyangium sorediatum]MDI1436940.1 hypothetical protein [Polyangium sorediatum]